MNKLKWILLVLLLLPLVAGCRNLIQVKVAGTPAPVPSVTEDLSATVDVAVTATPTPARLTATPTVARVETPTETPVPTMTHTLTTEGALELRQALAQGLIEAQMRGTGSAAGDSIIATLTRKVPRMLEIAVPRGTVLTSDDPTTQDMVVLQVRGIPVGGEKFEPVSTIRLTSDAPQEFLLEAYCLDFAKENPSATTHFSLGDLASSEVQTVLEALDDVPAAQHTIGAIQTAIWVATEDVCEEELQGRFPASEEDIENARTIFETAGIDLSDSCLFGKVGPQGQKIYLHGDGVLAMEPPPSNSTSRTECFFKCTQTWAITLTQSLQGNAYSYDLAGIGGTYNVRLLHTRGSQQTVLAEWLLRTGRDGSWVSGPQLDAVPGDVLTLEITLPASGSIKSHDYGRNSYVTVGIIEISG